LTATTLSVFALHTKSEETLVSSWIDLIAFAKRGAILRTVMFFSSAALEFSGIVFVTTICSMSELPRCIAARPERTGCVKHAWTHSAPASFNAFATNHRSEEHTSELQS